MCGIVGYRGEDSASEVVREALEKLEYRGYDSAGIATVGNPSLKIEKGEGTIDEVLDAEETVETLDGKTGIGHTRWATHGEVNDTNAHPHTGEDEHVAVVHNGIINNHEQLKKELEVEMKSDTDTEVIPHLIEKELEETDDLEKVCRNVMNRLEGSYAVLATLKTGEMVAMKQGSPLVVSESDSEVFLGSDVTPFLSQIDTAYFFEDGDYAVIDEEIQIFNGGERKDIDYEEIDWDAGEASKQGYSHFMEKEIHEQSKTIKRAALQDRKDMEKAVEMIKEAERVYLTGCGTSSYAASLGAKYLRETGNRVEIEQSHELEYRKDEITENDLVIAISQSGETADLLSLLGEVEADVLSVVNVVGSTLDRQSEHTLYVNAGPEIGVASTKAFTAQLTVLKMISYTVQGELEAGRESLIRTASKVETVLESNRKTIDQLSDYLQNKENVYFIGRSTGYDIARESALKLKELSYIHAESFPGGEFKHGTLALIEEETPVVGIMTEEGSEEMMSNIAEAKSRGADIIASGENMIDGFMEFIEIPEDQNSEILQVVPFQMLAYRTSLKKGNNPDKPRNLAKSVTVK
ncbi:MAG: glucosamine--fructose-6-phosphate aminotransferase (isomerizing) [Candidatus Nanohaloarchaea archaeon]|jgi:glucosamine--fructose-6-phosphate aminotransferase (isomerizing)